MSERLTGPPLEPGTRERLDSLFQGDDRERAAATLVKRGGYSLEVGWDATYDPLIERIRYGCLKLSEGTLEGLESGLKLARTDWRDLLVAAGFAEDPFEHLKWRP